MRVDLWLLSYVKHLLKHLKIFGGNLISMNIPPRKEEGSYVYSLKSEKDHMLVRRCKNHLTSTCRFRFKIKCISYFTIGKD